MLYKITTRKAQEKDAPFLIEGYADINLINGTMGNPAYTVDKIRTDLFSSSPEAFALIAEHAGKPVGFSLFSTVYFAGEGRVMWISQIYVLPAYRGKNVAYEMLKALKAEAVARKYGGICGATGAINHKTQRFLQKVGARRLDGFVLFSAPMP